MKCDELKAYKGDVTIPVYGTIADAEVYIKKEVDAAIATLRGANDEKSERIVELQKQVDELKAKLNESEEARYEAGADAADYYQENRRLKRALWLARAISAHNAAMMWEILSDEFLNGSLFTIDFRCVGDPDVTEFQIFRGCMDWMKIYENVERKCKAKAEEYK